jgi:hypothetical protein
MTLIPPVCYIVSARFHNLGIVSKERIDMNTTRGNPRGTNEKITTLEDAKINVKIILSALWVTLMLFYIYADIMGFYTPGVIEKVVSGEIGGIQITEGFLVVMAIWMAIPSLMVILSLILKANANRWVNIIVGIVSILVLGTTFFVGEFSARYTFHAFVEAVLIGLILWYAWKWPKNVSAEVTPDKGLDR